MAIELSKEFRFLASIVEKGEPKQIYYLSDAGREHLKKFIDYLIRFVESRCGSECKHVVKELQDIKNIVDALEPAPGVTKDDFEFRVSMIVNGIKWLEEAGYLPKGSHETVKTIIERYTVSTIPNLELVRKLLSELVEKLPPTIRAEIKSTKEYVILEELLKIATTNIIGAENIVTRYAEELGLKPEKSLAKTVAKIVSTALNRLAERFNIVVAEHCAMKTLVEGGTAFAKLVSFIDDIFSPAYPATCVIEGNAIVLPHAVLKTSDNMVIIIADPPLDELVAKIVETKVGGKPAIPLDRLHQYVQLIKDLASPMPTQILMEKMKRLHERMKTMLKQGF